ncbi:MAG: Gfo/Idh/MocA family oxidoreductase [Anaerolineae bacterium]|nr:Gfo/Idh/MocA family oxidoreductase [Anaerolineae bacterium]
MASKPVTAVIVGAGHRSLTYASYARYRPDALKIVGVADPLEYRRRQVAELYGLGPDQLFETAEELAARPQMADAAINGTMDQDHVRTSLPLLNAGYDLLLEKPFAVNETEMWQLLQAARGNASKVMICHVMRYTPFATAMRQRVAAGEIGEVISVQTVEHVSYHHMVVGYVRGKWNRKDVCGSPMLMAKCCHDLDFITWMKSGVAPVRVSSFGSNMQFRPEKAPEGAGTRCLVDCPIEGDCLYSARKHYIDHPERWSFYVWAGLEQIENPTIEDKIHSLKTDNPFGRCVWKCDNNVVDHQAVMIEFEDGCTATHNMIGGASKPQRSMHLVGTTGELQGVLHDSRFVIRHIDPRPGHEYSEEVVDVDVKGDMDGAFGGHGGGDVRLAADFVNFVRGDECSIACTNLEDSIRGHLIGFRADVAMEEGKVVDIPTDW